MNHRNSGFASILDELEPRQFLSAHHHRFNPVPSPGDPNQPITFAAIGDYGFKGVGEPLTAGRVHSWNPQFIITLGDNNYPHGESSTIDRNIGQYFHDYIAPYTGKYGAGSPTGENRFFPVPGNHDWSNGLGPYLKYFSLPNNERYYDFVKGPVHFFALDSDPKEPDGNSVDSKQARWLKAGLAASTSAFNVVYMHSPPYSSGKHGNDSNLQWPFAAWGADAVLSGDDHDYERINGRDGIPYFVNGAGAGKRSFHSTTKGSVVRFNSDFGAMLINATATTMNFKFITQAGVLIDNYTLPARSHNPATRHHHHHHRTTTTTTIAAASPAASALFSAQPLTAGASALLAGADPLADVRRG